VYKFTIYYDDGEIHRHVCYGKHLFKALESLRLRVQDEDPVWVSRAVLITREEIKNDNAEVQ
jgi:hypothetical protein